MDNREHAIAQGLAYAWGARDHSADPAVRAVDSWQFAHYWADHHTHGGCLSIQDYFRGYVRNTAE